MEHTSYRKSLLSEQLNDQIDISTKCIDVFEFTKI